MIRAKVIELHDVTMKNIYGGFTQPSRVPRLLFQLGSLTLLSKNRVNRIWLIGLQIVGKYTGNDQNFWRSKKPLQPKVR